MLLTAAAGCKSPHLNVSCTLQFVNVMTANVEKISGPVTVTLSNIMNSGSVVFTTTVGFLDGDATSAAAYKTALTSSASSIFGSTYAVQVDASSITDATVDNPSKLGITVHAFSSTVHETEYSVCLQKVGPML